jgi:putative cell wall-binding protein
MLLAVLLTATLPAHRAAAQSAPPAGCPTPYPVEHIRDGMTATGWTVSRGGTPEPFTVEVVGVQDHFFLHDRSIIVVDTDRPGNDAIHRAGGIWAGMSGSPIYAPDGRLLGALSFGFSFGPSKLAGLTPAQEMLDVLAYPRSGAAAGAPESVQVQGTLAEEVRDREGLRASGREPELVAMRTPVQVRDKRAADLVNQLAERERLGITAYPASRAGASAPTAVSAAPRPGGNFAAALSYGANAMYGSGTTSFVCGDQAMAFGHWMTALGGTTLGANDGTALGVVADPTLGPFKMMNMTGAFGTLDQDRFAGVRADLTRVPSTTPVTTRLRDLDGTRSTQARTDVVLADALPFITAMHLWDAMDSTLDRWGPGTSTLAWTAQGRRADGRRWTFTRENLFASNWDVGFESIFELWGLLESVQFNDFEDVTFSGVEVTGGAREAVRRVQLGDVTVSVDGGPHVAPRHVGPAFPGSVIDIRVPLTGKDVRLEVDLAVTIPEEAADVAPILVSGGGRGFWDDIGGMTTGEGGEAQRIASFDDLLASLAEIPQNNDLVARVLPTGEGGPVEPDLATFADPTDATIDRERLEHVVQGEAFLEIPVQPRSGGLPDEGINRVGGADRIATAVAVSQNAFGGAETVVIARADDYADALAGAPLAASVGGPLLLTGSRSLPRQVADEIARLGATRAIILGGARAVGERVADDLREAGVRPQRVPGRNRYDTARLVAGRLGTDEVYLTLGQHPDPGRAWADAIAVSGLAASQRRPILLTKPTALPPETAQALREGAVRTVTVVGGERAIPAAVARAARGADRVVGRVGGGTRYETSVRLARRHLEAGGDQQVTWLATGRDYADGLAAGPAAAATGGVLVLLDGRNLDGSPPAQQWLEEMAGGPVRIRLVGGRSAISEGVATQVGGLVGMPPS